MWVTYRSGLQKGGKAPLSPLLLELLGLNELFFILACMTLLDFSTLFGFMALLVFIGLKNDQKKCDQNNYLLANKETSLFSLIATLVMTELNSSTMIAFSSLGYITGLWGLAFPFIFLVALLFYGLAVAKKWKEFDGLSVAGFFTKRYSLFVGKIVSLFLLGAMLGFSAVYVKSLTVIFSPLFPNTPFWLLSLILVITMLIMTLKGGLVAIIRTDIFSFCLFCLFLPLVLFFSWKATGFCSLETLNTHFPIEKSLQIAPPSFVFSLIILSMFTYILAPWYGQKIFSAKSKTVAKKSVLIASVFVFLFYGMAVLSTALLSVSGKALASAEQAFPEVIISFLPNGLRGIGFSLFFSAAATTLCGAWNTMSSLWIADLAPKTNSENKAVKSTLFFALVSYILANLFVDSIFNKLILANIPILALSFALLGGFYWKGASTMGALTSLSVGLFWGCFTYLYFGEAGFYQWYWVMWGLPLIFGSGIAVSLLQLKAQKNLQI